VLAIADRRAGMRDGPLMALQVLRQAVSGGHTSRTDSDAHDGLRDLPIAANPGSFASRQVLLCTGLVRMHRVHSLPGYCPVHQPG
jgi:hypothetical protein